MRLCVCFLILCGVATAAAAQSAAAPPLMLSESDALARFEAAPRARATAARLDEVRARQAEPLLWPNPIVTYTRESALDAVDTFLLGRQELSIGGRRDRLRDAGRAAIDVAVAEAAFQTAQLRAEVRQAYTGLLLAQAREALVGSAVDDMRRLIERLRAREKEGEGSRYDRMRGERALLDLEADAALFASERAAAQGQLAALLGTTVSQDRLVASDSLEIPGRRAEVTVLIEQAIATRGDYRSAELSIAQFEAERLAASSLRAPTPTVSGGLKKSRNNFGDGTGYQFSLDVAVPLFNRGQAAEAVAAAQKLRAESEVAYQRARIEAEIRTAHALLLMQEQRAARYREATASIAEPLAEIGRVGYEEGELGILELLDAARQAIDARLREVALMAAVRSAAIELDRVTGQERRP
jgi:multidrug efflux system outer membrane protein